MLIPPKIKILKEKFIELFDLTNLLKIIFAKNK